MFFVVGNRITYSFWRPTKWKFLQSFDYRVEKLENESQSSLNTQSILRFQTVQSWVMSTRLDLVLVCTISESRRDEMMTFSAVFQFCMFFFVSVQDLVVLVHRKIFGSLLTNSTDIWFQAKESDESRLNQPRTMRKTSTNSMQTKAASRIF